MPLRIALCADGLSPHGQRWANGLADRGHEVAFVWMRDDLAVADLAAFRPSVMHHAYVPLTPRGAPWRWPGQLAAPPRLARRLRPDLVHGLNLVGHAWTAKAFRCRPLVLTALGSDVLRLQRRGGRSFADRAQDVYDVARTRSAVRAADEVFADSEPLAARVRERVPGTRTRIIRFGVELEPAAPEARTAWRRRLDLSEDAFVLLSSRLLLPRYGIADIVRALERVREQVPEAVLVLKELPRFSDPEYRRACLALVEELGLAPSVRVVGELERRELLDLQAAADVYVSVPVRDATAVSVFEAMAAGAAVVATAAPGIDSQILRDGKTALLVPVGDVDALAAAVVRVARDAVLRRTIVEGAREVVRAHGDFERELDRAVAAYEELIARMRKASS